MYSKPRIVTQTNGNVISFAWVWLIFVVPAWWALLYFGGSWGWCQAVCGWGKVAECTNNWGQIKAVCRR